VADFTLAREKVEEVFDYPVLITQFSDGSEQRRLAHAGKIISFHVVSPALTSTGYAAYRSHFVGQTGPLTAFNFVNPNDGLTYSCRYEPGSFRTRFAGGYRVCEFDFVVVNL